jgi:sulfite exporter TauE/SafE
LVASLHCAGMCAPLSCAMFRTCAGGKLAGYHIARALSYTALGALLGEVGGAAAPLFAAQSARLVPVALAALFLAMAFGLDRALPGARLPRRLPAGPAMLGLLTPLIPCGPLYLMLGVSLISGSWGRGALLMVCFALGTMPLYLLAQWQWFHLCGRMSPRMLRTTQRVLACISAGVVAWRALANGGLGLAAPLCH